ncbi:MAG TPA: hypothetical protein PLV41_08895, partial [Miltoncostaeales bacterium]|nr:hypothetical protein [Miltoncostaeales bacterium]
AKVIAPDGNGCTTDGCNPANGNPQYTAIPNCACAHSLCTPGVALNAAACSYGPPAPNNNCATV